MECPDGHCCDAAQTAPDQIWALILKLAFDRAFRQLGVAAAAVQLAPTQAMALHELQPDRPMPMRQLAYRLRCDPSNITGVTDRLEARGYVERQLDSGDRRVKSLALTAAGRRARQQLGAHLHQAPRSLADLSEGEQQRLRELLLSILQEDV